MILCWQCFGLLSHLLCCTNGPGRELALCSAYLAHAGGNVRLVAGMAEGLPIIYNSVVQEVEYSDSKVRVSTASTSYEGVSAALWGKGTPELTFVISATERLVLITSLARNVLNQHAGHLLRAALICL